MRALTLSEKVQLIREEMLEVQGGVCPICTKAIQPEQAVLDHCHKNGHVRAVLHRSCNVGEAKMERLVRRYFALDVKEGKSKENVLSLLANLMTFWEVDYSNNPYHPGHRFPEHKRISQLRKEIKKAKMLTTKVRKKEEIKQLQLKIKEKYGNN